MNNRILSTSAEINAGGYGALANLDLIFGVEVDAINGTIAIKEGTVVITKGSAAALLLATPTAGLPSAGGDDGRELVIIDTTGFAHTVTTAANKINGTKLTITFDTGGSPPTAKVAAYVQLVAYGGVWYTLGSSGVTVT
jgi:hypothetical protein